MSRRASLSGLLTLSLLACGAPTDPDPFPPNLGISGDALLGGQPAYGVVGILRPGGQTLATSEIVQGRYRVTTPMNAGVVVCDGYAIRIVIEDEQRARTQTVNLDETTGVCVMPPDDGITHTIDVDFPLEPPAA